MCVQVKQLSAGVLAALGAPDILINVAGTLSAGPVTAAYYEGWDRMIDANIRGHLHILGEFLPGMKQRGTGHIVNITGAGEKTAAPGFAVYCATKHFWTGMSAAMR